jgi:hypothetical protein
VVLVSSKSEFYAILFLPLLALLVGAAVAELGHSPQAFGFAPAGLLEGAAPGQRVVAAALAVVLAVAAMGFEDNFRDVIEAESSSRDRDYAALTTQLQGYVPPGSRVVAPPVFWIGLAEPPYYLDYVDFYVWERLRRERSVSWPEFLRDVDPDYVILDSKAKSDVTNRARNFMEDNAELVAQVTRKPYGDVQVWKMRDATPSAGARR